MPYIGSNISQKTAYDARSASRSKTEQNMQGFYQSQANKGNTTQRKVSDLRQSTMQRTQQRAANPILPKMTTQQRNNERNQAAAQQRAERNSRIAQSRNQG